MGSTKICLGCSNAFRKPQRYSRKQWLGAVYCSRQCGADHRYGDAVVRFGAAISPEPNSGCWFWMLYLDRGGYGLISRRGEQVFAHRFSYETFVGPIGDGLYVCHRCDAPACVNPDHLFLGTHTDNMMDCRAKGRFIHGDAHRARVVLSARDVVDIRRSALSLSTLADKYGIKPNSICRIRSGRRRSHA
jgi:hypothetical protein